MGTTSGLAIQQECWFLHHWGWKVSIRTCVNVVDFNMISTWFQHDFNMISTWSQHDSNMISTWFQHDFNMLSTWFNINYVNFTKYLNIFLKFCQNCAHMWICSSHWGQWCSQNIFQNILQCQIIFQNISKIYQKIRKKRAEKKRLCFWRKLCFSSARITNLRSLRSLRGSLTLVGACIPISCLVFLKVGVSSLGLRA